MESRKPGRRVSLDDACLILNSWYDSFALISCDARIGHTSFGMRGRLGVAGLAKIKLISDDGLGEFAFALGADSLARIFHSR
jgi:hypothetical protein